MKLDNVDNFNAAADAALVEPLAEAAVAPAAAMPVAETATDAHDTSGWKLIVDERAVYQARAQKLAMEINSMRHKKPLTQSALRDMLSDSF